MVKPFYSKDGITLYCGDSLTVIPELDLKLGSVVTDPPYEIGINGQKWDNSGISFNKKLWVSIQNLLLPGSHVLAFGATRTFHKLVLAIEESGLEIRDMLTWVYSSGMPSGSVSLQSKSDEDWKTLLKPSIEPICLARKAIGNVTLQRNFEKFNTGGLNIGECKVPKTSGDSGRYPANFIHDGSPEIIELFPSVCSGTVKPHKQNLTKNTGVKKQSSEFITSTFISDGFGSASRFFYCAKPNEEEKGKSNTHLTVKPIRLMQYLVKLVTPKKLITLDPFVGSGTTLLAAQLLNIQATSIEINEENCKIAVERLMKPKSYNLFS